MRRRRFLAALGGSASLGLGGLLSYRASRTRTLSVASVETYDAAFRLRDGRYDEVDLAATGSLDPEENRVLESAVDGGYETDDPTSRAVELADAREFVRYEGVPYRLSDTFPRLTVTAEPYAGDPSELSVATADRFHETIGRYTDLHDEAFLARARAGDVVDRDPHRRLRDFFETYDAVQYGDRHFQLTAEFHDPGPPYTLTAERVSERTIRDARSVNLADLDEASRDRFREAIDHVESDERGSRTHGLVDPDPEVVTKLRATSVLRAGDDAYHVDAWSLAHLPLAVTVTATESGIGFKDPGRLAFTVENTGEQPVTVDGGSPEPFGSLRYRPVDGDRERHLYPVEEEQTSSMWPARGSHHGEGDDSGLPAGQRRTAEYALGGDAVGVPTGRYVVRGTFRTGGRHRSGRFPFRVVLELE